MTTWSRAKFRSLFCSSSGAVAVFTAVLARAPTGGPSASAKPPTTSLTSAVLSGDLGLDGPGPDEEFPVVPELDAGLVAVAELDEEPPDVPELDAGLVAVTELDEEPPVVPELDAGLVAVAELDEEPPDVPELDEEPPDVPELDDECATRPEARSSTATIVASAPTATRSPAARNHALAIQ